MHAFRSSCYHLYDAACRPVASAFLTFGVRLRQASLEAGRYRVSPVVAVAPRASGVAAERRVSRGVSSWQVCQ